MPLLREVADMIIHCRLHLRCTTVMRATADFAARYFDRAHVAFSFNAFTPDTADYVITDG